MANDSTWPTRGERARADLMSACDDVMEDLQSAQRASLATDNLTPSEISDLSKVHAAAFDLVRKRASERDEHPPMWLCMSDDAKRKAVDDLVAWFSEQTGRPLDLLSVTLMCGNLPDPMLHQWRTMEATAKRLRKEGNPRAFFA